MSYRHARDTKHFPSILNLNVFHYFSKKKKKCHPSDPVMRSIMRLDRTQRPKRKTKDTQKLSCRRCCYTLYVVQRLLPFFNIRRKNIYFSLFLFAFYSFLFRLGNASLSYGSSEKLRITRMSFIEMTTFICFLFPLLLLFHSLDDFSMRSALWVSHQEIGY